ncbi:MAG: hypothetical protein QOG50_2667 [Actinomycetota bacterium]|jgi:hypothetical protein|nr:hypothetical protein [Actinomycetota bacterium]
MAGIVTLLCGAGGFGLASGPLSDNSFLWHLRTGRLILDHGIPRRDPYSFTAAGTRWIAQSWLAELMYGALNRAIGAFAIRIAVGIAGACIAVFLYRIALHATNDRVRALGLVIPALACTFSVQSERPLMFGLVLLSVVVFTIEVPGSFLGRHPRVVLPAAMWVWVNVHGTFSLGFVYLAVYLFGRYLDGAPPHRGRERDLLVGTAIAAAIIFVNPYGPGLVLFPLALMGRNEVLSNVAEWQSVDLHSLIGFLYAVWVFITLVAFARSRPRRGELVTSLVFLFLGWWAVRNVAIAVAVTIPIVGRAFRADPSRSGDNDTAGTAPPLLAVMVCLVSLVLVGRAASQRDFDLKAYPVKSFDALAADNRLGGRLLTTDAWAGYVIAKYWPEQPVFFDDRYDMYPIAVTDDYNKLLSTKPGWQRVLDKYRINIVVWPKQRGIVQVLEVSPGWTVLREDKVATVLVRDDPLR